VVVETGIGGLLDSTNTISSSDKIAVFTKFGLDHTKILGRNITQIANK
jgi:dihydrofolate synthase/folylpolyglutamate synthase